MTGLTGTSRLVYVQLYNVTDAAAVAGTEVAVDSDIFLQSQYPLSHQNSYTQFVFAAPVTLTAAKAYAVQIKAGTGTMTVSAGRNATTNNWCRLLRTTTTQAPAAGDRLIVSGEFTGSSASTVNTVTMDNTAATDFGTGSTTIPSLAVGTKGVLTWGTSGATAYYLKLSGLALITHGGKMSMGTTGTHVEATSSNTLEFDSASMAQFGFITDFGGEFEAYGASKTAWTYLTAPAAATDTVLTVADTTGWQAGDVLCIASTARGTTSQSERRTIDTVDSATQVTLTAGLTYRHLGTAPYRAEVGNLTRNVVVKGASATNTMYGVAGYDGNIDWNDVEYINMGTSTASATSPWFSGYRVHGLVQASVAANLSVVNVNNCAIHDMPYSNSRIENMGIGTFYFTNNVIFNYSGANPLNIITGLLSPSEISDNLFMDDPADPQPVNLAAVAYTALDMIFSGNHIVGGYYGIYIAGNSSGIGTFDSNVIHDQKSIAMWGGAAIFQQFGEFKITNLTTYFINDTYGALYIPIGLFNVVFENYRDFGSFQGMYIAIAFSGTIRFINSDWNGFNDTVVDYDTNYVMLNNGSTAGNITFENCDFGRASGVFTAINTAEIIYGSSVPLDSSAIVCKNCYFSTATEVSQYSSYMSDKAFVSSETHDNTEGLNKSYRRDGIILTDTTIYSTASPSIRMTPNTALYRLCSNTGDENFRDSKFFTVAVPKGATATITLKVRESVVGDGTDYNGSRIRLLVAENQLGGITDNTVLDTATASSEGAWETLSGTTAAMAEDTVLEIYADCGFTGYTAGWVNIDDFTATVEDTKGMKYFYDGASYVVGDNSTGGGQSSHTFG